MGTGSLTARFFLPVSMERTDQIVLYIQTVIHVLYDHSALTADLKLKLISVNMLMCLSCFAPENGVQLSGCDKVFFALMFTAERSAAELADRQASLA